MKMRLGDQSIMCTILYNIKRKLISLYPDKFNQDNLFFIYNNRPEYNLIGIDDLIKYAPQLYDRPTVTQSPEKRSRYSVAQIQPRFHNQKFNFFLRHHKQNLTDAAFPYVPLIPQRVNEYVGKEKNKVLILPTTGKTYHMERNWSDAMIIKLINTLPDRYKNVYIINRDVYHRDLTEIIRRTNKHITVLDNDQQWNEIVDIATQLCDLYVGGDCGFSHLLANMYGSPDKFHIFYRTRLSRDNWLHSQYKFVTNKSINEKVLIGIDKLEQIDQRMQSIYKRRVVFQDNQDGEFNRPYHSYLAQRN